MFNNWSFIWFSWKGWHNDLNNEHNEHKILPLCVHCTSSVSNFSSMEDSENKVKMESIRQCKPTSTIHILIILPVNCAQGNASTFSFFYLVHFLVLN